MRIGAFTSKRSRNYVVVGSALFVGLTLLISGTGKVPGQTEFAWLLMGSFWTPWLAYLIANILPWLEIVLGILLCLGIFPRIAAALFLPLAAGFMANNSWALSHGLEKFPTCASCFGIWEKFLGHLSPPGALVLDILLVCLALIVLLYHKESFLTFRPWFVRQKKMGTSPP